MCVCVGQTIAEIWQFNGFYKMAAVLRLGFVGRILGPPWDHKISAEVKEGPADCIRMDEVRAALKKMKKHKAPGLSGLVTEMIQATGDTGTQ